MGEQLGLFLKDYCCNCYSYFPSFWNPGYKFWFAIQSLITALNLLNTWTNAEVLGRVVITLDECTDARSEIIGRWQDVLKGTFLNQLLPFSSNILVMSMVLYAFILFQPLFAFIFAAHFNRGVDYKVGIGKHEGYWTMWQPNTCAGVDHDAVVQVLSALATYECVGFQDFTCRLQIMDTAMTVADTALTELRALEHTGEAETQAREKLSSDLAVAITKYYEHWQITLQRALVAKLIVVGFCQNAIQTKVQMTMFSLSKNLTGDVDPLFLLGVVGNLIGYLLSIADMMDLWKLYRSRRDRNLLKNIQSDDIKLRYLKFEELRLRQKRVSIAGCGMFLFAFLYIAFFVYQSINFAMIMLVCDESIWNVPTSASSGNGCYQENNSSNAINLGNLHI